MADAENSTTEQTQTQTQQAKAPEKETFSREYVQELREEAKGYRLKLSETEAARKAAEAAIEAAKAEAQEGLTKAQQSANERVIRAELKAAAREAGMVDLDGLKLADISKVSLDDKGDVVGVEELMASLKESKPYLFKQIGASSTSTKAPKPGAEASTSIKDLDPRSKEYQAARDAFLRSQK